MDKIKFQSLYKFIKISVINLNLQVILKNSKIICIILQLFLINFLILIGG